MKLIKDKAQFEARAAALEKFNAWEAQHPIEMRAQEALSLVGALYELIPSECRQRAFDPDGLGTMRQALSHLKGRS
jgi:hypothetical protein